MALSVGIVGMPNAGKSTLFNALTRAGAQVGNYPFTTIEPNTGMMPVPDERIGQLAAVFNPPKTIPAMVTFTDIAGLVRGASRGEGLGNQFLGHVRECDAIAMVVRAFADPDVSHVEGSVDPLRDIDLLELELAIADHETVIRRLAKGERTQRLVKDKDTEALETLAAVRDHLVKGLPVRTMRLTPAEHEHIHDLWLLTIAPLLVVANVAEEDAAGAAGPLLEDLAARAAASGGELIPISARIEAEVSELAAGDQAEFLEALGLREPGLYRLARSAYHLLDLVTFFTAGEKEVRAWTLRRGGTAVDAAGSIHTDFAKGFIRAEVCGADALIAQRSYQAVKEQGKLRLEGRDYVVKDGDVVHFRFNV